MLDTIWYAKHPLRWLLYPFSLLYQGIVFVRRWCLKRFFQVSTSVPIVVVGNITVGGVGKTPLVIALAQAFEKKGIRVGIVSRGYKAKIRSFPYLVRETDSADWVGDEPLLIARKTQVPVVIAPLRMQAVNYLIDHDCQLILSDDGLQHYRMGRAIEIAVVDGVRRLGNGLCLPAGPLRETPKRLKRVDFVVMNGGDSEALFSYRMNLKPTALVRLIDGKTIDFSQLHGRGAAVAGIGHPSRFYESLRLMGLEFNEYSFPDHHDFKLQDLPLHENWIVMTEKDAVKCQDFANNKLHYLIVEATLCSAFWSALWSFKPIRDCI